MNVFSLLERAGKRLQTSDALYHEQADTVLGILRSSEVIPYKRSSLNGQLHKLVCGCSNKTCGYFSQVWLLYKNS